MCVNAYVNFSFLQKITENSKSFLDKLIFNINQYMQAVGGIAPIFNYMVRFVVTFLHCYDDFDWLKM